MSSRRGRLNWSNLEVHISDDAIDRQHRFTGPQISLLSSTTCAEDTFEYDREIEPMTTAPPPPATKRSWVPKKDVGEIRAEDFVGNFMLTAAEQSTIDQKYKKRTGAAAAERAPTSSPSNPIRLSNRLPLMRETPLPTRPLNISVGQHLLNVFVCHVESYTRVYIMFGDDYHRATKLFQAMNTCAELTQPSSVKFEPKENDLIALHHENKWFRGQCVGSTDPSNINVLCIDSGVTIPCSKEDVRRLPDK